MGSQFDAYLQAGVSFVSGAALDKPVRRGHFDKSAPSASAAPLDPRQAIRAGLYRKELEIARESPAVHRVQAVLSLLARNPARSFTLSEIARRLLLNKATAHSLLNTMAGVGLLERHADFTFSLGREMVALGQAALSRHRVIGFARQEAATIAAETRMNCTVSICSGEHIIIVGNSGPLPEVGSTATPLVPPFGSVFLAWSKEEEVEAWLARAGNLSETARETLLSALDGVRKLGFHMTRPIDRMGLFLEFARIDGYADDRGLARSVRKVMGDLSRNAPYTLTQFQQDEAILPELIAVPAFGPDEDVALALTISGFSCPLNAEQVVDYVRILRSSCDRISAVGGGRLPDSFPDLAELRPSIEAN